MFHFVSYYIYSVAVDSSSQSISMGSSPVRHGLDWGMTGMHLLQILWIGPL